MESVLLTDEAVAKAAKEIGSHESGDWDAGTARIVAEELVRFHATEGREALVERVREAIQEAPASDGSEDAEAVVTALFGPPS